MKALIALDEKVQRLTGPITEDGVDRWYYQDIPNGARLVQIESSEFEVPSRLIWVDVADSVNANNEYYYDTSDSTVKAINHQHPDSPFVWDDTYGCVKLAD